jgi:protein involved in polysaccharide export with SLBB domain
MRFLVSVLFAVSCFISQSHAATANAALPKGEADYLLGVGDIVRIEVHDEADMTLETQIPSTGVLNYPFLGQIRVGGLNVAQLQARITDGLRGDYLIKPEVHVRVVQYRPFYVRGQVKSSGGFPYVLGLTVEKAATIAGGFTDRASLKNIFLIRENSTQEQKIKVGLDSAVAPGDTIIIEESFF